MGEADILVQFGGVLPIKTKSGAHYKKHRAVDNLMAMEGWELHGAVVPCGGNVERADGMPYLSRYVLWVWSAGDRRREAS